MSTAHILIANDGFPRDRDMLDLYKGFLELNYQINFYTATDVVSGNLKISKEDVFCGTINLCRLIWRYLKVAPPTVSDYPDVLKPYFYRNIRKSTLKAFSRMLEENEQNGFINEYFIKPIKTKLFTGNVFRFSHELEKFNGEIGGSTEIYISGVLNILSEYRVYVHKGKILDVKHYYGNWSDYPDAKEINKMVELSIPVMPVSYSVDVGVTSIGKTVLIECNDGYALGNYGLDELQYATMIRDRWMEIVNA